MDDLHTLTAHADLPYANPFGVATMERALDVLALPPAASVADLGAGFCELPIRLAERCGAHVVAVELSPRIAAAARRRIHERLPKGGGGVTLHEGDAGAFRAQIAPASYDLTVCIGSTHAVGGYVRAVEVLGRLTRPGGRVLIGEGFWEAQPSIDYLKATGIEPSEFVSHADNIAVAHRAGLRCLWSVVATQREWDEYEWAHARNLERHLAVNAADEMAMAMVRRSRAWRDAYLRWGRGTLGFGLYLFEPA